MQLAQPGGMPHFSQGFGFNLTNAFAGDAELLTNLLQGAGVAIAQLTLGPEFHGVLRWGQIDNRPFLRCLHGLGLCHWALGDFQGARSVFERILWLNPSDNQGARFCLAAVNAEKKYEYSGQKIPLSTGRDRDGGI